MTATFLLTFAIIIAILPACSGAFFSGSNSAQPAVKRTYSTFGIVLLIGQTALLSYGLFMFFTLTNRPYGILFLAFFLTCTVLGFGFGLLGQRAIASLLRSRKELQ